MSRSLEELRNTSWVVSRGFPAELYDDWTSDSKMGFGEATAFADEIQRVLRLKKITASQLQALKSRFKPSWYDYLIRIIVLRKVNRMEV